MINFIFDFCNTMIAPFWLLMIFMPKWKWTIRIISSHVPVLIFAIVYIIFIIPGIITLLPIVAKPDLGKIVKLLGTEEGTTIAWIHIIAFDLFVGRWIYLYSLRNQLSPWIISPILFLSLMFGPFGYATFITIDRLVLKTKPEEIAT